MVTASPPARVKSRFGRGASQAGREGSAAESRVLLRKAAPAWKAVSRASMRMDWISSRQTVLRRRWVGCQKRVERMRKRCSVSGRSVYNRSIKRDVYPLEH